MSADLYLSSFGENGDYFLISKSDRLDISGEPVVVDMVIKPDSAQIGYVEQPQCKIQNIFNPIHPKNDKQIFHISAITFLHVGNKRRTQLC